MHTAGIIRPDNRIKFLNSIERNEIFNSERFPLDTFTRIVGCVGAPSSTPTRIATCRPVQRNTDFCAHVLNVPCIRWPDVDRSNNFQGGNFSIHRFRSIPTRLDRWIFRWNRSLVRRTFLNKRPTRIHPCLGTKWRQRHVDVRPCTWSSPQPPLRPQLTVNRDEKTITRIFVLLVGPWGCRYRCHRVTVARRIWAMNEDPTLSYRGN